MKCVECGKKAEYVFLGRSLCRRCFVDTQKQAKEVETKLQEAMKEIGIKDYSFDQIKLIDTEKNEKTTNLASKKKNKQKNATGNETMYR